MNQKKIIPKTESELKKAILTILYVVNTTTERTVSLKIDEGLSGFIQGVSPEQMSAAVDDLTRKGYIKKRLKIAENFLDSTDIEKKGKEYVEKYVNGHCSTGEDISTPIGQESAPNDSNIKYYVTTLHEKICGIVIPPCFNVNQLSCVFARLIDSTVTDMSEDVPMLGIFAPWGRGKSYFWSITKDYLGTNSVFTQALKKKGLISEDTEDIKYYPISFNAWKYQSAPGIWAYLFENIYKQTPWIFRVIYSIKRNIIPIILDLLIFTIPVIITYILKVKEEIIASTWVATTLGFIITIIQREYKSVSSIQSRYHNKLSFTKHLGVQFDIENELSKLFKSRISEKEIKTKRVLLYIDDIDRCEGEQIVQILENLRAVLENIDIKNRLVVVCSIDASILYRALEKKYSKLCKPEELKDVVKAQFDKLFIASISLPILNNYQFGEYLDKISGDFSILDKYSATSDYCGALRVLQVTPSEAELCGKSISEQMIKESLMSCINKHSSIKLTPRQLNHCYYRSLLAISLIGIQYEYLTESNLCIMHETIEAILLASYGNGFSSDTLPNADSRIVETVIPYYAF